MGDAARADGAARVHDRPRTGGGGGALLDLLGPEQPGQVQVLGVGVYIWNVRQTERLLQPCAQRGRR
jgi:hypothetical protein